MMVCCELEELITISGLTNMNLQLIWSSLLFQAPTHPEHSTHGQAYLDLGAHLGRN